MTLNQLISTSEILKTIVDQKLPFKLAYKFSNLISIVDKNSTFYAQEVQKIFDECAQKDEDGNIKQENNSVLLIPEKAEQFHKEFEELNSVEITDTLPTFKLEEFDDKIELTPRDVSILSLFIEE